MSTTAESAIQSLSVVPNPHNVLPLGDPMRPAARRLLSDTTVLRISNVLQSSLQVSEVVHAFARELRRILPGIGVVYRNRLRDSVIKDGEEHPNQAHYELKLTEESLGEVTVSRAKPLAEKDFITIENVLCTLVYPLRNALLYETAIDCAMRDPLTGINNRASMETYLHQQVSLAQRHDTPLSLVLYDIDLFKAINDAHGHIAGDTVLTAVARSIAQCVRDSDAVFRYGGEEFVVVLTNTHAGGGKLLANRIRNFIRELQWREIALDLTVTVSAGIAELCGDDVPIELLQRADRMLYRAKDLGRDQVCVAVS